MLTVSVKWQKELFPKVEIDTSQPPYLFKCQLYDLTGVPPERQKIMVKGGLLKDDADWAKVGVKEGQKLMMMGTADEVVKAPEKGPVFAEDMPEEEQVATVGHSAGLINLGNTCYMNSTIQCLHFVPELKSTLMKYLPSVRSNEIDMSTHQLTVATRELFNELDKNVKPVAPMRFLTELRKKYPQFAQVQNGLYMQQDAEECWTQLLYTLSLSLKSTSSSEGADAMKRLFGIDLVSRSTLDQQVEDSWKWKVDPSCRYSVHSAYEQFTTEELPGGDKKCAIDIMWNACVPNKIKVFCWRVLLDRLPTKDNLQEDNSRRIDF